MLDQAETTIICPYCGETFPVLADPSVPEQEYVEDCQVCCQPIVLRVTIMDGGEARIDPRREND